MPIMAADKLMRVLRANGHEAQLEMTDEVITRDAADVEESAAGKPPTLCFVEFDEAYLEFIRGDLIRLGLMSSEDLISTGDELDGEEWLCPKCGKSFDAPGKCPLHQLELVTFEDYAGGAKAKADTMPPWLVGILVAVFAAAIYYKLFR
jgi:rubrerythrin